MKITKQEMKLREEIILKCAKDCFCSQGINGTSLSEIAKHANIGDTTLYRYFSNKTELVVQATIDVWDHLNTRCQYMRNSETYKAMTGIDQVRMILQFFINLYDECPEFYKMIFYFTDYAAHIKLSKKTLLEIEKNARGLKEMFKAAVEKGQKDGTVCKDYTELELYYTTRNFLSSYAEKLLVYESVLSNNNIMPGRRQLEIAQKLLLNALGNI